MGPLVIYKFVDAFAEPMLSLNKEDKATSTQMTNEMEEEMWDVESSCSNDGFLHEVMNDQGGKVFKRHSYA